MTVVEYQSWMAFYQVEPFGDVRADMRSGIVSALIARTMGGRRDAVPLDFMPVVRAAQREREEQREVTQRERNLAMRTVFESNLGPMRVHRVRLKRRKG